MPHVFISYVHNNKRIVQRLCDGLETQGVTVWLDRNDIAPGIDFRQAIRRAIENGAFFIACFSKEYSDKGRTYMNEELTLAIDELRQYPTDRAWFIPVKLNRCEIPDRRISAVETLGDIQCVELYSDWDDGVQRIADVILSNP